MNNNRTQIGGYNTMHIKFMLELRSFIDYLKAYILIFEHVLVRATFKGIFWLLIKIYLKLTPFELNV